MQDRWENVTKDECVLCVLRDKETKKAIRGEWFIGTKEQAQNRIDEVNSDTRTDYYEISEDEDLRRLCPLPLSQRQYDLNDIFRELKDLNDALQEGEWDISHTRSTIDEMNDKLDEYIEKYAREDE
ncbi:MAG: hypothetical protein IJS26_05645 [Alphaproteobacteria bacterium]|nr:hypothetical protein [Alphaproteobacteria bacterium]